MTNKNKYYWDSCMFYEWLCDEKTSADESAGIEDIVLKNEKGENQILTSVITSLEVLPKKLAEKNANRDAFSELFGNKKMGVIDITVNILKLAKEIRDFYYKPANTSGKKLK